MKIKSLGRPHLVPVGAFDYAWEFDWEEDGRWAVVRAYRHHLSVMEAFTEFAVVRTSAVRINQALKADSRQSLVDLFDKLWTRI
jgi:hypothetical protein